MLQKKFKRMEIEFQEGLKRERRKKAEERRRKAFEDVGKEPPEPETIEPEPENRPVSSQIGKFLADITAGYTSEDLAGLTDAELETLAVRFKTHTKDGMFGAPPNPFVAEIKKRMLAQADLEKEKAEIRSEIANPTPKKGFLEEFFGVGEQGSEPKQGQGKGLLGDLLG